MKKFLKMLTNKEVSKKVLFTLFILIVYKIGMNLTIPGTAIDSLSFESASVFGLMNMFGGGALQNYSVFAMGITPYITAGIVVQLLAMGVIPVLSDWNDEGENGKRKTEKVTRYIGFVLAIVQGFALTYGFDKQYGLLLSSTWRSYVLTVAILTAGTMILVWLGDMITTYGVGNGASMIIVAGIISSLPSTFSSTFSQIFSIGTTAWTVTKFVGYILLYLLLILGVIIVENAENRIPIRYATGGMSNPGARMSYLPIKINSAGVLPIIFAQTLLTVPVSIAGLCNYNTYTTLSKLFSLGSASGLIIYGLLTFGFAFLYTHMILDVEEMSDNLKKQQGFIPGVRAGKDTEKHITKVINGTTMIGAIAITVMALLPYLLSLVTSVSTVSALGGTGVIIICGVAADTISQLQTVTVENKYSTWKIGR